MLQHGPRAVLIVLGVLSLLLGLALVAGGGAVAALLGQKESISTQPARMTGTGGRLQRVSQWLRDSF